MLLLLEFQLGVDLLLLPLTDEAFDLLNSLVYEVDHLLALLTLFIQASIYVPQIQNLIVDPSSNPDSLFLCKFGLVKVMYNWVIV